MRVRFHTGQYLKGIDIYPCVCKLNSIKRHVFEHLNCDSQNLVMQIQSSTVRIRGPSLGDFSPHFVGLNQRGGKKSFKLSTIIELSKFSPYLELFYTRMLIKASTQ